MHACMQTANGLHNYCHTSSSSNWCVRLHVVKVDISDREGGLGLRGVWSVRGERHADARRMAGR